MFSTTFYGRLTRDPDAKYNDNGMPYSNFTVAVDLPVKNQKSNDYKTAFVGVTAFGKQAETIVKYFHKGSRIVVTGSFRDISIGQGNDGRSYLNTSVTLTDFAFVDTKNESGKNSQPAQNQKSSQNYSAPPNNSPPSYNAPPATSYANSPNSNIWR